MDPTKDPTCCAKPWVLVVSISAIGSSIAKILNGDTPPIDGTAEGFKRGAFGLCNKKCSYAVVSVKRSWI